ncbi:MAG TPA: MobF family relaxase [Blastocatellia bacterium]|nr:MobF family relaxase [Blastocatellia bacterium]
MVTISAALSVSQARDYYENEYGNPALLQTEYYSERGSAKGEWFGKLAAEWGLAGEVTQEQFYRAVEGQHPLTGEQLINHVESRRYINKYGEEVETAEHRAGWDATFTLWKSGVILAYMSGDSELKRAIWQDHIDSVHDALSVMEEYACARIGNGKHEHSGNFIVSLYHHERARPSEETGYAAPNIHTHAVIMNMTRGTDGEIYAMQEIEFFRSQAFLTAIYRTRMAERMQRRGIALEVDMETGAPEVKGISREYIEAASPRNAEIKRKAAEMKDRLESNGHTVTEGAGLNQAAAKLNRQSKNFDVQEMIRRDAELEERFGFQAHAAAQAGRTQGPIVRTAEEMERRTKEAVTYGINHVMENEAVNDYRALMTAALNRNMTFTTYDAVLAEVRRREQDGELVEINRRERMAERTTQRMLDMERRNIKTVLDGKGMQQAMAEGEAAERLVAEISYRQNLQLNSDQRQAVLKILANKDRIVALQGRAGVGKTTAMRVFREGAERSGYAVCGIAPTTIASKELGKSGIRSQTLESFLLSKQLGGEGARLIVLDESSLSDTRRINALFKRIGSEDRILLVGDRDQHQAIEAGAPFEQFQRHGVETIWIKQVVRQQELGYREAVTLLQDGKIPEAINLLQRQGRIIEVEDDDERFQAVAERFVARPVGNLAVAPGNKERVAINAIIHRLLQEDGLIDQDDQQTTILVNRDNLTGAEREFAARYKPGQDILRYREGSDIHGIKRGEYGRVVAQEYGRNTLTVEFEDGRTITYDPRRLSGVEVFKEAERAFAVGERIQFRRPFEHLAANGELAIIEKIEEKNFTVRLQDGQRVTMDVEKFKHFDYGYALTSFLSQGQTAEREIVHIDTRMSDVLVNLRMLKVALTRGVHDVLIVTDSIDDLIGAVQRRKDKMIGLDALRESEWLKEYRRAATDGSESLDSPNQEEGPSARESTKSLVAEGRPESQPEPSVERRTGHQRVPQIYDRVVVQYRFSETEKPVQKLLRVKRKSPCPICNKPDWCSVAADGAFAICMRVPSDHEAKNGGYVHILDGTSRSWELQAVSVEVKQYKRADIDLLHEINQQLLGALTLRERDFKDLLRRGLDENAIDRNGYKSVPVPSAVGEVMRQFDERDLRGIPGFYRDGEKWRLNIGEWRDRDGITQSFHKGFLIPVRDVQGRVAGFQVRRAEVAAGQPRYIWLSSSSKEEGCSSGAPAHYRNIDRVRENGQIIITEGALKGDIVAHLLGDQNAVIALAGVSSFQDDFGQRLKWQLPELRQVVIAFDADAQRKSEVQHQLGRLSQTLVAAGLDVRELHWEESQGKGLDDYLLKDPGHRNEVGEFLKESLASLNRGEMSVANPVSRDRSLSQDGSQQHSQELA